MRSSSKQPRNEAAQPGAEISAVPPPRRAKRLLVRIAMIIAVVAVATVGLNLWQERTLGQASAALERGDAKYAHFLLEKFLQKHPGHQPAMALQARTFVALGAPDEAIALFDQVGAANVDDVHAWARALMIKSQWTHAVPLLKRVLDVDPKDADALYELTACQVRLGKFDEALVNAEKLTENPEQAARGYVFVAAILGDMGNHDKASKAFLEVLKREPAAKNLQVTPDDLYLQQGRTFMLLGKPAEALDPLKRSVAIHEAPEAFVLLGDAAMQLGEPRNAALAWQKAIELDPLNREARVALANIALQSGQGEEALKWLKPLEAVPGMPASAAYLFQRTYTLLKNEDEIKKWQAITAKQRRIEELNNDIDVLLLENPEAFWARVARAHRFAERGNWSEAEVLLKRLLKEAPAETFVIELADAVFRRAELPSIEKLPVEHF
jgi:tetratricopeptide (TPR) repeat protein